MTDDTRFKICLAAYIIFAVVWHLAGAESPVTYVDYVPYDPFAVKQ